MNPQGRDQELVLIIAFCRESAKLGLHDGMSDARPAADPARAAALIRDQIRARTIIEEP